MKIGSLFAGVGGFDLGFERAGHQSVWQVEIDPKCRQVLATHFPHATRYEDVRAVGADNLAPVDCIVGGFPCQDLSVAGRRAGLAGKRSGLWHEFSRIIGELRPRWCVVENVPGLLSSHGGRDFAALLRGLAERGYLVTWRVLDFQFAGLAQRRKRVFIVGSLGDGGSAQVLLEPESVRWNSPPSRAPREGVASSLGVESAHGGTERGDGSGNLQVAQPLRANRWGGSDSHGDQGNVVSVDFMPTLQAGSYTYERGNGSLFCVPDVAWALQERDGKGPDSDTKDGHLIPSTFKVRGGCEGGGKGYLGSENQALTLAAGGNDMHLHERTGVRRLTPRECERLQGFPDDWTSGHADSTRYRMMGNAVSVPVIEWIARRMS